MARLRDHSRTQAGRLIYRPSSTKRPSTSLVRGVNDALSDRPVAELLATQFDQLHPLTSVAPNLRDTYLREDWQLVQGGISDVHLGGQVGRRLPRVGIYALLVPHMLDILAVEVLVGFEAACESLAIGRRGTGPLKVNV
jgi:hypothetical protein